MRLKARFFLWITTLVTFVVLAFGALSVYSERQLLRTKIERNNIQSVERLAKVCEETIYQQNDVVLFNYLQTLKREEGFVAALFLDEKGSIRTHSNPKMIGQRFEPNKDPMIKDLSAPVNFGGSRVGTAHIFFSLTKISAIINETTILTLKRVSFIAFLALLFGYLGALLLAKTLVNPIQDIVQGMRHISKGELEPISFKPREDELGWMSSELNITIAKLKELDEMKKDFVQGVTHDLRSPLNAIEGFVTMLMKGLGKTPSETQRDFLNTIQNNTARLTRMVDDLLLTARLEANREDLECHQFDINGIVQEVAKLYTPMAQQKGIELNLVLPKSAAHVWADPDKVSHILNNLVSNAFKFTHKGSVTLTVHPGQADVAITVSDTGPGIPLQERAKIFDKFYRTKEAKNVKGTGLGLAIVKGLVEAHGGSISVEQNNGGGSRFVFSLKRAA